MKIKAIEQYGTPDARTFTYPNGTRFNAEPITDEHGMKFTIVLAVTPHGTTSPGPIGGLIPANGSILIEAQDEPQDEPQPIINQLDPRAVAELRYALIDRYMRLSDLASNPEYYAQAKAELHHLTEALGISWVWLADEGEYTAPGGAR